MRRFRTGPAVLLVVVAVLVGCAPMLVDRAAAERAASAFVPSSAVTIDAQG